MIPPSLNKPYLLSLAMCFARQEGYVDGKWEAKDDLRIRGVKANNPGNIMKKINAAGTKYALVIYNSPAEGWRALLNLIQSVGLARGFSLYQFIEGVRENGKTIYGGYASSHHGDDSATYIENVSSWMEIPTDISLKQIKKFKTINASVIEQAFQGVTK